MARDYQMVDGKWMIEEMQKEFELPLKLWSDKIYRFSCRYVLIGLYRTTSAGSVT